MVGHKKSNLFYKARFGFRKQLSTKYAITYLSALILERRNDSNSVCDIFLDFA